jgi:cell division protease FtsH
LCMTLGGRVAEEIVFGMVSTGAQNDLVVNTELARRMVREFGMSEKVGPMAWGSNGPVFLGEDLMGSARDYSDVTARIIDEEVQRILREQEKRAQELIAKHRRGLDLIAAELLEKETVDGAEVARLVQEGLGQSDRTSAPV